MVEAAIAFKSLGGKSKLVPQILELMPTKAFRYHEPFLGGGAVFLALANAGLLKEAYLGDVNPDLVAAWNAVFDQPRALMKRLDRMPLNDEDAYYSIRDSNVDRMSPLSRAARFVFLNKSCWGGVWRTNAKGEMNAPFGKGRNLQRLYDPENIAAIAGLFKTTHGGSPRVVNEDYPWVLKKARKGDVVYFDPPYVPVNVMERSFTRYAKGDFRMEDQRLLRDVAVQLAKTGVRVVLSNSSAPAALELYAGRPFTIHTVHARRSVNSRKDDRKEVPEILVTAG